MSVAEAHPFYPPDAKLPHYVPNTHDPVLSLTIFVAATGVFTSLVSRLAASAGVRGKDNFAAVWFAFCGVLHICFEGYLVVNHATLAGSNTFLAQLWKEYSLSDSRYLLSDPFVIAVESITVCVWGPLSIITFFAILARSPARHMLQIMVCMAHLYGLTLYFATTLAESRMRGVEYCRPEAFYYWAYFLGANMSWYCAPLYLMRDSYGQIVKAFRALEDKGRKSA